MAQLELFMHSFYQQYTFQISRYTQPFKICWVQCHLTNAVFPTLRKEKKEKNRKRGGRTWQIDLKVKVKDSNEEINVGYTENPRKAESNFLYRFHISIYNDYYILREFDQAVHLMLFLKLTKMCRRNLEELYLCQVC